MQSVLFSIPSGIALVLLANFSPWSHHRHTAHAVAVARVSEPRSLFTILSTHQQLAEAARRAATFERAVAARATARAAEYDALAEDTEPGEASATVHALPNGADGVERRSA